jgi:hypothetical protein
MAVYMPEITLNNMVNLKLISEVSTFINLMAQRDYMIG